MALEVGGLVMEEYIRKRVEEITSPIAYQYGLQTKQSIYWQLNELVSISWRHLKNFELAEEVKKARDKYGKV